MGKVAIQNLYQLTDDEMLKYLSDFCFIFLNISYNHPLIKHKHRKRITLIIQKKLDTKNTTLSENFQNIIEKS